MLIKQKHKDKKISTKKGATNIAAPFSKCYISNFIIQQLPEI
jgi:hypothetical protein